MSKIEPKGDGWGYAKCHYHTTGKLTWEGDYIKNANNRFGSQMAEFYTPRGWISLRNHDCVHIEKDLE